MTWRGESDSRGGLTKQTREADWRSRLARRTGANPPKPGCAKSATPTYCGLEGKKKRPKAQSLVVTPLPARTFR
jgi:hypothetical protein